MTNEDRSGTPPPEKPQEPAPANPLDRRQLVRRLALSNFAILASPLLRAASASPASRCGVYSNGLIVPDANCTQNTTDSDCGQQIIQGGNSTVSSDEDCGTGANGTNPDNCCGGISWAPQGGSVGYFNDISCGSIGGGGVLFRGDADCGLPNPQGVRMRDNDCGSWVLVGGIPPILLPPSDNYQDYDPIDPEPL